VRFLLAVFAATTFVPADAALQYQMPRAVSKMVVRIDREQAVRDLPVRFLSVALDTAHLVGAPFWGTSSGHTVGVDLNDKHLRLLASAIGPSYLRVGGTDADRIGYDMHSMDTSAVDSTGRTMLTAGRWNQLADFAREVDFQLVFTLNLGGASRDENGDWDPASARPLLEHAARRKDPVAVWEAGNELNAFWLLHAHWLTPHRYVADVARLRLLVQGTTPEARIAGPAIAFWPGVGEGFPFLKPFLDEVKGDVDIVSWHYYPTQSVHCPVSSIRARASHLLTPMQLDEVLRWATLVKSARDENGHPIEMWLGETGSAQCGGEPGFSDRFASSFWWLDELGTMARQGQSVVIRQSLVGGDYALIDLATMRPRPDYWATVLWRRLMGSRVLVVAHDEPTRPLRVFAHCTAGSPVGSVSVLLINLHDRQTTEVVLPNFSGPVELYRLTASSNGAEEVMLGTEALRLHTQGELPELKPNVVNPYMNQNTTTLAVTPQSIVFAVYRDADFPLCR
jgi:heparanase